MAARNSNNVAPATPVEEKEVVYVTADQKMVQDNREIARAAARRKELIKYYKDEKKVITYVSPMYRPYFGNVMTVTINGISIRFPVDGSKQEIPATFADEIERRRRNIDNIEKKQKRMASIKENEDKGSIGSLSLF
jgi:hypothetical protein